MGSGSLPRRRSKVQWDVEVSIDVLSSWTQPAHLSHSLTFDLPEVTWAGLLSEMLLRIRLTTALRHSCG